MTASFLTQLVAFVFCISSGRWNLMIFFFSCAHCFLKGVPPRTTDFCFGTELSKQEDEESGRLSVSCGYDSRTNVEFLVPPTDTLNLKCATLSHKIYCRGIQIIVLLFLKSMHSSKKRLKEIASVTTAEEAIK